MATFLMRRKKSKVENAYNLEQSALELTPYEYYSFWKNIMSPTKEQSDTGPKFMKAIIEKILLLENETAKKKQVKILTKADSFLNKFINMHCLLLISSSSSSMQSTSSLSSSDSITSSSFSNNIFTQQNDAVDGVYIYKLALFHTFRYCLHFSNVKIDDTATNSLAIYLKKKRNKDSGEVNLLQAKDSSSLSSGKRYRSRLEDIVGRLNDEINQVGKAQKNITSDIIRKAARAYVITASMFDQLSPTVDFNSNIKFRNILTNLEDFDWLFYRKKIKNQKWPDVFLEICQFIGKLPPLLTSGLDIELIMSSFCACLLFLKQLLAEGAPYDTTVLQEKLLPTLKQFCSWPYPYGKMAQEMEYLVSSELRAPGAFFRAKFYSQFPILSVQGLKQKYVQQLGGGSSGGASSDSSINSASSKTKTRRVDIWPEMQRTVLLYTSSNDHKGNCLADILRHFANTSVKRKTEKQLSIELQKRCLYVIFQQTLDIFDPSYVPKSQEEERILQESGGWRRVKESTSGMMYINSATLDNDENDILIQDPLEMNKCKDDLIQHCYTNAVNKMLEAEENSEWPIHAIRSWCASSMAEILQQINNRFIALPANLDMYTSILRRNGRAISFKEAGKTIMRLQKAKDIFLRRQSILFSDINDRIHPVPAPSSGNKVDFVPKARTKQNGYSFTFTLPEMQFDYAEHRNLKDMKYPMWNGDFHNVFRNSVMNDNGQQMKKVPNNYGGRDRGNSSSRDRGDTSSGDIDDFEPRLTSFASSFGASSEVNSSFDSLDTLQPIVEENCPSLYNSILRYPEAQYNNKMYGEFLKSCDISLNPSFKFDGHSTNGNFMRKKSFSEVDNILEEVGGVVRVDDDDDDDDDDDYGGHGTKSQGKKTLRKKIGNNNNNDKEEEDTYSDLIESPKLSFPSTRKPRSRSETLQRTFSRSRQHMLSSWKNDDYRKIASAGLLGGGNIVYNGTQNDIEFFKSSSVLRICALGNDSTLHRILCNYVVTMQEFHEKLSKLSVRIFVAPTSKRKNRLATYIASKDAWYRRHIYTPLSSPTFGFPYSSNQKNGANLNMENTIQWIRMQIIEGKGLNGDDLGPTIWKKAEKDGITTSLLRLYMEMERLPNERIVYDDEMVPGKTLKDVVCISCENIVKEMREGLRTRLTPQSILIDLMEDYVRYGKYILPVCIYQCECWESVNVAGKGKSFIIPFCSSVEVGVRANSDRFKRMMMFKEEEQLRQIQGKNRRTSPIATATKSTYFGTSKSSPDKGNNNKKLFSTLSDEEVMVSNEFLSEMNTKSNNNSDLLLNNIKVKYKAIGPNGENLNVTKAHHEKSFYNITLSNVGHYANEMNGVDLGSSPLSPNLELFTHTGKSGIKIPNVLSTISKRAEANNGCIKQEDVDTIDQALNEGGETILIHECIIKMKKQERTGRVRHANKKINNKFMVLIDGELFGPFEQIKIKPMLLNEKQMYLPVATFKPL